MSSSITYPLIASRSAFSPAVAARLLTTAVSTRLLTTAVSARLLTTAVSARLLTAAVSAAQHSSGRLLITLLATADLHKLLKL